MIHPIDNKQSLTVIIPIYNEAETLVYLVPQLLSICGKKGWKIIFVNDGSTDNSAQILALSEKESYVKVIHHKINRGYGGALKSGISNTNTSYIVTIDGDGQHNIYDIEKIFQFAKEKDADLVIGNRSHYENANYYRGFGKWIIRNFARILIPFTIHDLNSGFKVYQTELAKKYIHLCPNSAAFSDVITLTFISQYNLVLEYPISVQERKVGKSTVGIHTAFEVIIEIINLSLLFNPLKIFISISTICWAIGLSWGIPIVIAGRGVSVGAMLAIVLGALFFALGLIANQLSAIRMESLDNPQKN